MQWILIKLEKKNSIVINSGQAVYFMSNTEHSEVFIVLMHQSFVPPTGMGGDFQRPSISPTLWGQADGNNPTLSPPPLHHRKSNEGKCPNVITLAFPWHCGDNQKVLALHHSPAIPPLSP